MTAQSQQGSCLSSQTTPAQQRPAPAQHSQPPQHAPASQQAAAAAPLAQPPLLPQIPAQVAASYSVPLSPPLCPSGRQGCTPRQPSRASKRPRFVQARSLGRARPSLQSPATLTSGAARPSRTRVPSGCCPFAILARLIFPCFVGFLQLSFNFIALELAQQPHWLHQQTQVLLSSLAASSLCLLLWPAANAVLRLGGYS